VTAPDETHAAGELLAEPPPPPPPSRRRRGPLFWLAAVGVPLLLCCGGLGVAALVGAKDWIAIAFAPPGERKALVSRQLEGMAPAEIAAARDFFAAIDEERDDAAWEMTSAAMRAATPRPQFDQLVSLVRRVMGRLQSTAVVNVHRTTGFGAMPSLARLTLEGTFENGAATINVEVEDVGGTLEIRTWRVDSPLFLDAMERGSGK
jgi:hypothetical protein